MRETLRYGLILGLICFFAGAVLSVVNAVTEPKIKQQKEQQEKAALKEVMPGVADFEAELLDGQVNYYLAFDEDNKLTGFVIKSKSRGYSSDIEVLTGLNLNLEITNIKILSQNETPGVGTRIKESLFKEQFKGKNLDSLDSIEAITGATISSTAVIDSIKKRISELKNTLLEEIERAR